MDLVLETDRLILRPPRSEDLPDWTAMMADEEVARHIGGPHAQGAAWINMAVMAGSWMVSGFGNFSVLDKASGRFLGRAGPWRPVGWPGPEIGWAFRRDAWGQGYATEAAARTIDWAFATLGWSEIIHVIDEDNARSVAVARRLGSRLIGPHTLQLAAGDKVVSLYGQSRLDWETRRPA